MADRAIWTRVHSVLLVFLMVATLLAAPPPEIARAAVLQVDQADEGCSDSEGAPYCTIQAAIDAASTGDTISVAPGTYLEVITIGDGLTLIGTGALPSSVVVDAQGLDRAVTLTAGDATFENLTITGGSSTNQGGGIHVDGGGHDVILTNVIVDGNEAADDGGGIWIDSGNTLTIVNSTLSNNVALGWGGAIYSNGADVTVIESTISGNSSTSGGGIASNGGTMDLSGGDVANNTANSGALFWDFENATAVGPVTTATGLSTGSVTGFVSQTGGGSNPVEGAENFGAAGKVHLTRFMSETGNYPYMEFISTGPVQLEDVTFQHFHNHNLTYPTNPDYDVQLQLFEGEGWSDIGSPLNLSDANYGETSTIGLTSVQTLAAGTHRIRWVPRVSRTAQTRTRSTSPSTT